MPDQQASPKIIKSISGVISEFETSEINLDIEVEFTPGSGTIQSRRVLAKLQVPDPNPGTQSAGYLKYTRQ